MFEQAVLDNTKQRRSKWSWMGLVIQSGLVGTLLLVPMISPEILSVMLPKDVLYTSVKPVAPVEVEVQPSSAHRASAQSTMVAPQRAARVFTAPRSYDNPVNDIIDSADFNPPAFTLGGPVVSATSGPLNGTGMAVLPTAPPPAAPPAREPAKPIRVGGSVQAANILNRVSPQYPDLAKKARISGIVRLEGVIARDGTVQRLQVLSGHPLLVKAAVDAVQQWRYRPTYLNGEPVEVIAPIEVKFILSN